MIFLWPTGNSTPFPVGGDNPQVDEQEFSFNSYLFKKLKRLDGDFKF
jgi:hypothetical protein